MAEKRFVHPSQLYRGYIFDLDGTVYLGENLLPTAGDTIRYLRKRGCRTIFLSNNPTRTRQQYAQKLNRLGLPVDEGDIINSSFVMVDFLSRYHAGKRLFIMGERPLINEITRAGFELSEDPERIDLVIASFDRTFVYRKLQIAFDAIRNGAHFIATNADRYCPVPGGGEPDAAAIIAAVEASTDHKVEAIVGKPSKFMIEAVLNLIQIPVKECIITGDRLETDIQMGINAGMDTAVTLTGATNKEILSKSEVQPKYVLEKLEDLIANI